MGDKEVVLTLEGLKKLEMELEYLRTARRREVAERIKQAKEFGDLSENSEYEDAKNEQAFVEGRIMHLEKLLRKARVIDDAEPGNGVVNLGSKVMLRDLENDEVMEYTIVGSLEADPARMRISNESPVGKALMGQVAGSVVEVKVPAGMLRLQVINVS